MTVKIINGDALTVLKTLPDESVNCCVTSPPFGGSGTVGMVSEQNGRNSILIELNPKYVEMAKRRTAQQGLFGGLAN